MSFKPILRKITGLNAATVGCLAGATVSIALAFMVLCNILGNDIEAGLIPDDIAWTGEIVQDICYRNAKRYFGF